MEKFCRNSPDSEFQVFTIPVDDPAVISAATGLNSSFTTLKSVLMNNFNSQVCESSRKIPLVVPNAI